MNIEDFELTRAYRVVLNYEEQQSIWPVERENALGWRDAGKTGTKDECLAYIKDVWVDMRPLSLRDKITEVKPVMQIYNQKDLAFQDFKCNIK